MGEWSKSIGEKGEHIVKFVFEEILEFNSLMENSSINCNKGEKHKRKESKGKRNTHGIDGLLSVQSPVEDSLLDLVCISSKYTKKYPENPKTLFRNHFTDLAFAIECFQNSELYNELNQEFNTVTKTQITGVLVWLSNDDNTEFDMISKVNNFKVSSDLIFDKILLLDNKKINFLYESIYKTKNKYGRENTSFAYHNSGLNNSISQTFNYNSSFPINYLYSDIIPLRIQDGKDVLLSIFINEDFSKESLSQILHFAQTFNKLNSIEKTIINFKTYDKLTHENDIKRILKKFNRFKLNENLNISTFPLTFRDH